MKTIQQIDALIAFNAKEAVRKNENGQLFYPLSKIKSFKRKITTLRQYRRYLETEPRQEFVEKMRLEAKNILHQ